MKNWILRIPRLIQKNTRSHSIVYAGVKLLMIALPLGIGLIGYAYLSVEFCKSLFLYAAPLAFDTGCFLYDAEDLSPPDPSVEEGLLLKIGMIVLFIVSVCLCALSLLGVFVNEWVLKLVWLCNHSYVVYAFIFMEALWYILEMLAYALMLCFPRNVKNRHYPYPLSHDSDGSKHV